MSRPEEPALSVVLARTGGPGSIATTVRHLLAQTIREHIELLLVGPRSEEGSPPPAGVEDFWGYAFVSVPVIDSIAHANAAGVRAARAPVVALAEDHCFPEPGWAEALVAAHASGRYAAVGPAVTNANPGSRLSWADFVIGYGPWALPIATGEMPFLPGHNSSYDRRELLALGDDLEGMLAAETVLHMDLAGRGRRLLLCAEARTAHVNFSLLRPWLRIQAQNGRVFAATRAAGWSPRRRALWCLASPLIPLVRLARSLRTVARLRRADPRATGAVPFLVLGLALDGAGQALGYARGPGGSLRALTRYEFSRIDFVRRADREIFDRPPT